MELMSRGAGAHVQRNWTGLSVDHKKQSLLRKKVTKNNEVQKGAGRGSEVRAGRVRNTHEQQERRDYGQKTTIRQETRESLKQVYDMRQ